MNQQKYATGTPSTTKVGATSKSKDNEYVC